MRDEMTNEELFELLAYADAVAVAVAEPLHANETEETEETEEDGLDFLVKV
ncbi:MAG: hypothetical protein WA197_23080 [Candidatus Acidiferrales bacterium]